MGVRAKVVSKLIATGTLHDREARANGWQDSKRTEALARTHHAVRAGATGEEIAEADRFRANHKW